MRLAFRLREQSLDRGVQSMHETDIARIVYGAACRSVDDKTLDKTEGHYKIIHCSFDVLATLLFAVSQPKNEAHADCCLVYSCHVNPSAAGLIWPNPKVVHPTALHCLWFTPVVHLKQRSGSTSS